MRLARKRFSYVVNPLVCLATGPPRTGSPLSVWAFDAVRSASCAPAAPASGARAPRPGRACLRRGPGPPDMPPASVREILRSVGEAPPEPFTPATFQREALEALERGDVLVSAPTGSGKTWIAEQEIARLLGPGGISRPPA